MADWNGEAERVGSTPRAGHEGAGIERAGTMLVELVEASRAAAEALLDEQKHRAAAQVTGLAEAVRSAAQCLERSETWGIGGYTHQAAGQIERLSHLIGDRSWSEIVAETRDFARRRPWLFLAAAAAVGFLAGRVLSVPTTARPQQERTSPASQLSSQGGETEEIIAAVSSGDGRLAGQQADISARPETH